MDGSGLLPARSPTDQAYCPICGYVLRKNDSKHIRYHLDDDDNDKNPRGDRSSKPTNDPSAQRSRLYHHPTPWKEIDSTISSMRNPVLAIKTRKAKPIRLKPFFYASLFGPNHTPNDENILLGIRISTSASSNHGICPTTVSSALRIFPFRTTISTTVPYPGTRKVQLVNTPQTPRVCACCGGLVRRTQIEMSIAWVT